MQIQFAKREESKCHICHMYIRRILQESPEKKLGDYGRVEKFLLGIFHKIDLQLVTHRLYTHNVCPFNFMCNESVGN
jgi:hypothetical protein